MNDLFEKAAEIIKNSDALLIGAGAGMGVDSGLPDFRGTSGFWRAYPPIAKLGLKFEEMAAPRWFSEKPRLAWAFYGHRFNLYKKITPHIGFKHLLELGNKMKLGYFVFTSNVDGHFQKTGFKDENIYEIHGSINYLQCNDSCTQKIWKADFENLDIDTEKFEARGDLPKCPHCGALARPNILMFGDWHWLPNRADLQYNNYINWTTNLRKEKAKLVILEFGAGKAIPSVRKNSEKLLHNLDAKLIRINPRDYDTPLEQIGLPVGALEGIEKII